METRTLRMRLRREGACQNLETRSLVGQALVKLGNVHFHNS